MTTPTRGSASRGSAVRIALGTTLGLIALATSSLADNRGVHIHLGDGVTSSLAPAADADEFVFDALEDAVLTISAVGAMGSPVVPAIALLDPSGDALSLAGALKEGKKGDLLKKLVVSATGRYQLRISGHDPTTEGAYRVKTKQRAPRGLSVRNVELSAGEIRDFRIGAENGTVLKATIKGKKGQTFSVVSVLDPQGNEVPGAVAAFAAKRPKVQKSTAKITLNSGFGNYTVRVGNAPAPAVLSVKLRTRHPKRSKQTLAIDPVEPQVTGVSPPLAAAGDTVTIQGANFVQGAVAYIGDSMATSTTFDPNAGLFAVVPPGVQGDVRVSVQNPDGQENGLAAALFVLPPPPDPTGVDPTAGTSVGGLVVTVSGSHFTDVVSAALGGVDVSASLVVVSDTELRLTTPAHEGGSVDLSVTDRWARAGTLVGAFSFGTPYEDVSEIRMPGATGLGFTGGNGMALGDLDGDEDLDLVLVSGVDAEEVAESGFETEQTYGDHAGTFRVYPIPIHLNDGNGDFTHDQGTPPSAVAQSATESDAGQGHLVRIGDVNGDDHPDLVVGSLWDFRDDSAVRVLLNDGDADFRLDTTAFPRASSEQVHLHAQDMALGDIDDDGDLDVVLALEWYATLGTSSPANPDYQFASTRVLINDGYGAFADETETVLPDVMDGDIFASEGVALGDLDNDGALDMVVTTNGEFAIGFYEDYPEPYVDGSLTRVLMNDGYGRFTNETATRFPEVESLLRFSGTTPVLAHLDGDSYLDLVLGSGRSTRIFLGGADGFEQKLLAVPFDISARGRSHVTDLSVADSDGDGDLDLFLMSQYFVFGRDPSRSGPGTVVSSLRLLKNDGHAVFTDATASEFPGAPNTEHIYNGSALTLGDVDGDADTDVLVTNRFELPAFSYYDRDYGFYGSSFRKSGSRLATRLLERK